MYTSAFYRSLLSRREREGETHIRIYTLTRVFAKGKSVNARTPRIMANGSVWCAHRKIRFAQRATNDMTFIVYSRVLAALHTLLSQRPAHASSSASLFAFFHYGIPPTILLPLRIEGHPPRIRSIFDRVSQSGNTYIYKPYRRVKASERKERWCGRTRNGCRSIFSPANSGVHGYTKIPFLGSGESGLESLS